MTRVRQRSDSKRKFLLQGGVGVALMVASIIGVATLLNQGTQTRSVAVSKADVPSGTRADLLDVEFVEVPDSVPTLPSFARDDLDALADMVLTRPLRPGDLISSQDFSLPENVDLAGITLDLSIGQPEWLAAGQRVTLWVAPPASENSFSAPFVLSSNVLINSVNRDDGFASDGAIRQVDVLVLHQDVPGVVHALANKYFLYLVPEG